MGGKHKKHLRAEKAKVKLKGAKLPKGLNVTKTEFKVRKIVMREQLHDDFNEEQGKRNINVKETLSKLRHHNLSMRMDALKQCKEIIEYHLGELSRNLGDFIQGIANIILDIEGEPRKEALKQLSALLSSISTETAEPFFNILCSYLRCGMTHIHSSIQRDSLLLLDSLISNLPTFIALKSDMIFKDFLDMISKNKCDSANGRMLTLNVENKTTNIKWRREVLLRLHSMLSTVIEYRLKKNASYLGSSISSNRFNPKEPNYFMPLYNIGSNSINSVALFCSSSNSENIDDYSKFKNFISQLMPLLFETWLEVSPSSRNDGSLKEDISLNFETALSLKVILEIISKIWDIVEILDQEMRNKDLSCWFSDNYHNDFKNYFLTLFPYKQSALPSASRSKSKEKREDSGGADCYPQNFHICNLYCKFFKNRLDQEHFNRVLINYVTSSIENTSTSANFQVLDLVLKQIFLDTQIFQEQFKDEVLVLLKLVITKLSDSYYLSSDVYHEVYILLCSLLSRQSKLYDFSALPLVSEWLSSLPNQLIRKSVSNNCLITLSEFAKQQNTTFLESLKESSSKVFDNIGNIQITGSENQFEGKKRIMQLFYWLTYSEAEKLDLINQLDSSGIRDKRIVPYFKSILSLKSA